MTRQKSAGAAAAALAFACAFMPTEGEAKARKNRDGVAKHHVASFYRTGVRTASGEMFDPHGMTAAHRSLPFGTLLTVRYGGKAVTVRINDRGPFVGRRSLDLSFGAARAIGLHRRGVAAVRAESPQPRPRPAVPLPQSEPSLATSGM